jgi:IclR family acetate operon transcriptional repressor
LIVEEVVRLRRPVTVSEIAHNLALPMPTAHRMVRQLVDRGVLKQAFGTKRVLVGPRLATIAAGIMEAAMVADAPHEILARLAAEIGEHCHIGVMAEGEVLYIDSARSGRSYGLHFEPGRRSPLHCTSIGKILLAELSEGEFERWLKGAKLKPLTQKTIVGPDELAAAIAAVRARGWAASDEEVTDGVIGCAVPIRARSGELLAALGISVPSARLEFDALSGLVPRLREAAAQISAVVSAPLRNAFGDASA